ncbi:MAG TPA: Hsp20/alpha crystallin family protein [Syntrophorhabdaceae bacterium]|nr:Hsp20/alpha crystallin family protein [Syntrophorhabdaceae bacterium]HOD75301.1 Hsp20/alpha crystallin family protein [Syntrophorhabdaceae bacterium]
MADKTKDIPKKEAAETDVVERTRAGKIYNPDVDIMEGKDKIIVIADMPGVNENSVEVTLDDNVLTIYGRVDWKAPEKMKLIHAEYGVGDFQRIFTISGEINREKIQARVKNGVLRLVMPKNDAPKMRKIAVKAG